jgi:hypothetical protein
VDVGGENTAEREREMYADDELVDKESGEKKVETGRESEATTFSEAWVG